MRIEVLEAIPAAGKTKAFLRDVRDNPNGCVVASISRKLSKDSLNYYESIGGSDMVIIDGDHCSNGSVTQSIKQNIDKRVIFITHKALLEVDLSMFEGRDLYIDEVPDLVNMENYRFKEHFHVIEKYCDVEMTSENMGSVKLKRGCKSKISSMINSGLKEDDCISRSIYPIFQSLLQELPVKIKKDDDGIVLFFVRDSTMNNWDKLNTVTIACANFEETFTGKILKHWCKWEVARSDLNDVLDFYEYPNSERVTIHVLCDKKWSRTVADKKYKSHTVYEEAVRRVQNHIGNESYLYTTNKSRGKLTGREIQYNPHGLNRYMNETNIVALFSYNPMPWQVPILNKLSEMCDMPKDTLAKAFTISKFIEPVFQLCTRGNIRIAHSKKPINLYVPDLRTAKYLIERYIPKGKIDTSLMIEVERDKKPKKRKPKSIPALLGMNKKQRANWYYHVRTKGYGNSIDDPKDIANARKWLNEQK
ncbi:MAG: hypothetical protein CL489_08250 [Acidobacteria bacterium]|nr:hypothetical protein [Acidobacteriota bacterium]|tara:strand:+ start:9784 stop:11211 length:1428 start_codon:yes stop_codon:yes gene_type:complete